LLVAVNDTVNDNINNERVRYNDILIINI